MRIALICNFKKEARGSEVHDKYAEFDSAETLNAIKKAIELSGKGRKVKIINADEKAYFSIKKFRPDFVFNIAEGLYGRSREAQIPLMLEYMQIPYSGSCPLSLSICLDKVMTKEILIYHGIPTPKFQVFSSGNEKIDSGMKFPMICKLIHEGSSMGLSDKSVVDNESELRKQVKFLLAEYREDVLVEEFIEGKDITVAVVGNENLEFLPAIETYLDKYPKKFRILNYEAKNIGNDDDYFGHAGIDGAAGKKIKDAAVRAFRAAKCSDFCRIDFRLDKKNNPSVLELNPLPGLSPSMKSISLFPKAARLAGISYNELIRKMLETSLRRNKIQE
ncbi:MAG: ATP-grasp domain-containing protein [archaeon]